MNGGIRIWGAARCRATRRGATSTCAACSSWSRRRSSARPSGSCSSRTTIACGSACSATIASFLTLLWRNGALMGTAPEQAFYVKCDAETNPPEVIDAGQLVCEIGLPR